MHYTADAAQTQAKQVAMKQLASLLGLGVAGGVGYRALTGVPDLFKNRDISPYPSSNIPYMMPVSRMHLPTEEQETPHMPKIAAAAATAAPAPAAGTEPGMLSQWLNRLSEYLPDTHTLKPLANEWGIPAGVAALGTGAYGGYKGVDWLINQDRKGRSVNDLRDAENNYQEVGSVAATLHNKRMQQAAKPRPMPQQYNHMLTDESGGLAKLSEAYVKEPAAMEKSAILLSLLQRYFPWLDKAYETAVGGYDNWQAIKGGVNTAAGAAALGAGGLTYNWAKGQNSQELLRQALARRQAARQQLSPPPIMALSEDDTRDYPAS